MRGDDRLSLDEQLGLARRAVRENPDDELAKIKLDRLEDRLGLKPKPVPPPPPPLPPPPPPGPTQFQVRSFWNSVRSLCNSNGFSFESDGDAFYALGGLVHMALSDASRPDPSWTWARNTRAGMSYRPVVLVVQNGTQVCLAAGRAETGPGNIVSPEMVWPTLRPWAGAHEHSVILNQADMPVQMLSSWRENDIDIQTGVCSRCGESNRNARLVASRAAFQQRLAAWANNGSVVKVTTTLAIASANFEY